MLKGSCLCGGIRYEIDAPISDRSRIVTAASAESLRGCIRKQRFGSRCSVSLCKRSRNARGVESSPGNRRRFCRQVGSPILKRNDDNPDTIRLRLG